MEKRVIKVGMLGLSNLGQLYLSLLSESDDFQIVSIADRDTDLSDRLARKYDCKSYDDFRQLILASNLDLLIDGHDSSIGIELTLLAIKNNSNVLKLSHAGPSFEDIAEILKAANKANLRYITANTLAYSPGFTALRDYFSSEEHTYNDYYLLSVYGAFPTNIDTPENRWMTDPELAFGGVLLHNCFEIIQEMLKNIAMPEQIYALTTNLAPDKKQRLSLTEDAAILTMKFPDRLIGTLEASRVASPALQYLKLYRPGQCLTATKAKFVITDNEDSIVLESSGPVDEEALISDFLADMAQVLRNETVGKLLNNEPLTLNTMALIKSSYLSFKTLMPENPQKLTKIAAIDSNQIWG